MTVKKLIKLLKAMPKSAEITVGPALVTMTKKVNITKLPQRNEVRIW